MSVDYKALLKPLKHRELRFFAFACCRSIQHLLHPQALLLLEATENYFMGKISLKELDQALKALDEVTESWAQALLWNDSTRAIRCVLTSVKSNRSSMYIRQTAYNAIYAVSYSTWVAQHSTDACVLADRAETAKQLIFIDEVHNPNKRFSHPDAKQMALIIRKERAWDQVKYLGDLLQDVGCTDQEILQHCYQDHKHHLGCWVVEMLLK